MASLFRARRRGEGGSGGKVLRGRRALPPFSPYARPENPPPPPAPASPALSRSPRWFQGLISGARKLISTVFRSEGSSSSGYSSDSEFNSSANDKEDADVSCKHLHELNQGGNRPNSTRDCMEGSQAVVSRSECKLVIEQLLMQETFTRDECNKLTKIIQSRVVESPFTEEVEDGTHKETSDRDAGSVTAFLGSQRSLNQDLLESIQYSASKLKAFSPWSPAVLACTPDLHDTAIMEAKKWLEEKKQASSSKQDPNCGPCTLSTDMLQYVLKRKSLSTGLWDTLDETRRVRLKLTDDILEIAKFKQIDSSARLFESETSKSSLGHYSNCLERAEVSCATPKLASELNAEDLCSNGTLKFSDQKAGEENTLTEKGNVPSINIVSEPEEALNAVQPTNNSSLPDTNLLQPVSSIIEGQPKSSNHNVLILEENKEDGTELSQNKVQDGNIDVSHESLILASKSVEHSGNLLSETKAMTSEDIKAAAPSDADGATNHDNNHTCSMQTVPEVLGISEANDSSQLNLGPGLKETHAIPDWNPQIQKEANGSTHCATGSSTESNVNSDLGSFSKGDPTGTNSIHGDGEPATAGISEGTRDLQNECATDIPVDHDTNSIAGKSRIGTRMKSIERMLTEPQPSTRHRRRKAVTKAKRGRGAAK